jgi:hypothetical protein
MTLFLAEARPEPDRPGWLEHTFYVHAEQCDQAVTDAVERAAAWPSNAGKQSVLDGGRWVYLARVSCAHGELNVTEWQDSWLRMWVGLAEDDEVSHAVRFDKAPPAEQL